MSTKIITKNSQTTTSVPTTSDVDVGELAVNTADKRVFTNDGTSVVELGTAPSSLAVTGNTTVGGTLGVTGNVDINGGNIDGTTIGATTAAAGSFTTVSATGNITVGGTVDGRDVAADGTKLDGIEAGADVTDTTNVTAAGALMDSELTSITAVKALNQGVATTDSPTFAGLTTSADINFGDNDKAVFGAGSDLEIYHSGDDSFIDEDGTGRLYLRSLNGAGINLQSSTANLIRTTTGGAVELYYDGGEKLATTSTGVDVTGTVTADGLTVGDITTTTANVALDVLESTSGSDAIIGVSANGSGRSQIRSTNSLGVGSDLRILTKNPSGNTYEVAKFGSGGDISFYEDTGTTAKFFWDASAESLGIGTSSPAYPLDVKTINVAVSQSGGVRFGATDQYSLRLQQLTGPAGQPYVEIRGPKDSNGWLAFTTGSSDTERMRIDSSGNVGIGTSSPADLIHVKTTSNGGGIRIQRDSTTANDYAELGFLASSTDNGTPSAWMRGYRGASSGQEYLTLGTTNTERMRIDSSGNLLVGKTSSSFNVAGHSLLPSGYAGFTRDGGNPVAVNRLTSDGDLIRFDKNGSTVGSIGTRSSALTIGQGDTGLEFNGGVDAIVPHNTGTNAIRDAAIDFGYSGGRFKDLYLSGGVYLGGTGAANHLDDYDEGTFTPYLYLNGGELVGSHGGSYSANYGRYVKIGKLVHVDMRVVVDSLGSGSSSDIVSMDIPFIVEANSDNYRYFPVATNKVINTTEIYGDSGPAGRRITFKILNGGTSTNNGDLTRAQLISGSQIRIQTTYRTA
jgi:hypothetical protein